MSKPSVIAACALSAAVAGAAWGAPPAPITSELFPFPGSAPHPPSAISAGFGLADRWLGDEPFSNPAAPPLQRVSLSPALLHSSRQDLRSRNRDYDETPAFFEGAGASVGLKLRERFGIWLYVARPAVRLEDFAFTRGLAPDPNNPQPPAFIGGQGEATETRAGLAISAPFGALRAGVGVEWCERRDFYSFTQQSGAPDDGTQQVEWKGNAVGFQAGTRVERGSGAGSWVVGIGGRYLPPLDLEGEALYELVSGTSTAVIQARRGSGWEAGFSTRYGWGPSFSVLGAIGGSSGRDWEGFGVESGRGFEWRVGVEYQDAELPWTARLGVGQEQQAGVPESRAGTVGIGLGWRLEGTRIELGAMRRGFERSDAPVSYDDRVIATVSADW